MTALGFKQARALTIRALRAGPKYIQFEDRAVRESKNLLDTGAVTPAEVVELLQACRGDARSYQEKAHDTIQTIPVHIFKPTKGGVKWYIKVYFLDTGEEPPVATFISVHRSNR